MKAETISKLTGKMVLSDDSGLQVDVLGGLPGVWSARFAGPEATDAEIMLSYCMNLPWYLMIANALPSSIHLSVAAPGRDSLVV